MDLRKYSRQTIYQLLIGAIILIFVIGLGLIWFIYGAGAAGMGLICLLAGIFPVVLVILSLWVIDVIVKRNRPEE